MLYTSECVLYWQTRLDAARVITVEEKDEEKEEEEKEEEEGDI